MAGKKGPETKLAEKMDKAAKKKYGKRLVYVNQHGGSFSATGISDRLICVDGMFVAIEIKAPESSTYGGSVEKALAKGPTVKQRLFLDHVRESGGVAGVAATIEQYMDLLRVAELRAKGIDYIPGSFPERLSPYPRTGEFRFVEVSGNKEED